MIAFGHSFASIIFTLSLLFISNIKLPVRLTALITSILALGLALGYMVIGVHAP